MKHDPQETIERLFHEARELKGEDRERFLSQECGGNSALRRTIEMLLAEDETSEKFLDTPMLDLISTTLAPGTMLGPYEVLGVAGIGAMGQVYRAHDRRLNRDVAIKALPAEFTLAGEPLARLQREATLLASVNHPNVAAIYDVLERDLADSFLILEYVEGPTLAERLGQGPVPLDETLHIAHQIALALEAAHDKGIVHRDLKPANIKLPPNGIVKILDFGLAKVFTDDLTAADPSAAGLVRSSSNANSSFRGTPAYMSPEQVVGTAVDQRADIWAFGCVVFELLTGRRAFEGNTVSATSASIQEAEPDWSLLPGSTPIELRHLLQECLEKDAKLRPRSASELRRKTEAHSAPRKAWQRKAAVLAAIMLTGAALAAALYWREPRGLRVEQTRQLTFAPELELDPALSPDGERVAYSVQAGTRTDIYVRRLAGGEPLNLTSNLPDPVHHWPRWSPNGTLIAFVTTPRDAPTLFNGHSIQVIPSSGGTPRQIASGGRFGHTWSPNGKSVAFIRNNGINIAALDESAPNLIANLTAPHSISWSPDGRWIAYVSGNFELLFSSTQLGNIAPSSIGLLPVAGGEPHELTDKLTANSSPVWSPDSKSILFLSNRGGSRDVFQLKLSDAGIPLGEPLRLTTGLNALSIDLSTDGKQLVYLTFLRKGNLWSIPIPETGPVSVALAQQLTSGSQIIEGVSASRDGKWLTYDSNMSGNQDVYRMLRASGQVEQLTTHPQDDFQPSWSGDGKFIAFHTLRNGNRDIYAMAADGSELQQVTSDRAQERYPDWSPDGQSLAFLSDKTGRQEVYVSSRQNGVWGQPRQLTFSKGVPSARWSPDGNTIAYTDLIEGLRVISPKGENPKLLVPRRKGFIPIYTAWSSDSRTIYFRVMSDQEGAGSLWSIPSFGGTPKRLVEFQKPDRIEFATDGKEFFFPITERDSDIWVAKLAR
jgi:Tol biopolymer transport system component